MPAVKRMDIQDCKKQMPPHPCDGPKPCDPMQSGGICPEPYLCQEKIKNPVIPGEMKRCIVGASIPAKSCIKQPPPHPCDALVPCKELTEEQKLKKPACEEVTLCREKIKNPDDTKKPLTCDPKE